MSNMHDSGQRQEFDSGAVRDTVEGKTRADLISPFFLERLGEWLRLGAEKYAERNWESGIPISRCWASIWRHLLAYQQGRTDEDHLIAIACNVSFIAHYEHEIAAHRLPASLDDMPKYEQKTEPGRIADLQARVDSGELLSDRENDYLQTNKIPKYPLGTKRINPETGNIETYAFKDEQGRIHTAPTFYIAGPMRGYENLNFPLFDKVADLARKLGWNIINPADLDRTHGIDPVHDPESMDRIVKDDPNFLQTIVQRDIGEILTLDKTRGDGMILLPGWEKSTGARAEVATALWLELSFYGAIVTMQGIDLCTLKRDDICSVLFK